MCDVTNIVNHLCKWAAAYFCQTVSLTLMLEEGSKDLPLEQKDNEDRLWVDNSVTEQVSYNIIFI